MIINISSRPDSASEMKVCRPSGTWAETYAGRKGHRTVATHCQQWGGQYALKHELHLFDYFLVYRERAVVTAKLLYASQAWCAFATTSDRQRIEAFIRRGVRLDLYGAGDPSANQLARTPTTACSGESCTANITPFNTFSQISTATATVSDHDDTTSP